MFDESCSLFDCIRIFVCLIGSFVLLEVTNFAKEDDVVLPPSADHVERFNGKYRGRPAAPPRYDKCCGACGHDVFESKSF